MEVAFLCKRKQGVALALPVEANREDAVSRAHFGKWMIRHIDSWFAFTRHLGLGIEMEDIVLVTGRHRTRSHYNIVFNKGQNSRVLLRVQTPATDAVHWQVLRQQTQGAMLGRGPSGKVLVAISNNQWTLNSTDVFS